MLSLIQDWGFWQVIIGVLFGVISTWAVINGARSRKDLRHKVLYNAPLVSIRDEAKERIKILFDNKPIEDANLAAIEIFNYGRLPVATKDYEKPLAIEMGDKALILSADVIETKPKDLEVSIDIDGSQVKLQPTLLNEGDSITIRVIGSTFNKNLNVAGRVIGVKAVRPMQTEKPILQYVTVAILSMLIVALLLTWFKPLPSQPITLSMRIQDGATHEPISNASVTLESVGTLPVQLQLVSDSDGIVIFNITASLVGQVGTLRVQAPGYSTYIRHIVLEDNSPISIQLDSIP